LREVLTDREAQIAALATAGHRNSEIARRLRITAGTVKVHLHNIYRKLGVSGRVQLILWAQSNDLQ
jgi:two-component system nitrate/nitrite response regulator NarL